jgi:hypothetical protein
MYASTNTLPWAGDMGPRDARPGGGGEAAEGSEGTAQRPGLWVAYGPGIGSLHSAVE